MTILLDSTTRIAQLVRANGRRASMPLVRQEKRYRLLQAFASRDVPAGAMLDYDTLSSWVNDSNGNKTANPWGAIKALAHQINETARDLLNDPTVQLLRATARTQRGIIIVARCRFKKPEIDTDTEHEIAALEDVTGISASTGEAY